MCHWQQEATSKWVIDRVPLPEPNQTARVGRATHAKASRLRNDAIRHVKGEGSEKSQWIGDQ